MPVRLTPITKAVTQFFGRDAAVLREAFKVIAPDELATILSNLPGKDLPPVIGLIEDRKLADVLWHLSAHARETIVSRLGFERVAALMGLLESDDIADLIQMLDRRKREKAIELLRKSDPKKVLPLLGFEEETAGGLMKSEFLKIESDKTVEDLRKSLSGASARALNVYVVDPEGVLLGSLSLVRMAAAPPQARVAELMHAKVEALAANLPQEDVVHRFAELDAVELPVVDPRGRILGVVTADDLIGVIREELAEDISRMSGVSEDEHIGDPAWLSIRRRLPWLVVNLATALLAAWVVSSFSDTIAEVVILAALMPIVAGMGGNAVTQTLGVSIRALALGQLNALDMWKVAFKQMLTGAANGLATGVLMGGIAYAWTRDLRLALVLTSAMTINLFVAGAGGVLIPVTMKKMRIDPALASTVFATTLTDVVGFFTFLGLASLVLH